MPDGARMDFNFSQPPRAPLLLPTNPPTDSPSIPPFFAQTGPCYGCTSLPPLAPLQPGVKPPGPPPRR
jgi:hypothetical protein